MCPTQNGTIFHLNFKILIPVPFRVRQVPFQLTNYNFKQDNITTYTQDEVLKMQNEQLAYQENIKMLAK